jgi:hypothetical protein
MNVDFWLTFAVLNVGLVVGLWSGYSYGKDKGFESGKKQGIRTSIELLARAQAATKRDEEATKS